MRACGAGVPRRLTGSQDSRQLSKRRRCRAFELTELDAPHSTELHAHSRRHPAHRARCAQCLAAGELTESPRVRAGAANISNSQPARPPKPEACEQELHRDSPPGRATRTPIGSNAIGNNDASTHRSPAVQDETGNETNRHDRRGLWEKRSVPVMRAAAVAH